MGIERNQQAAARTERTDQTEHPQTAFLHLYRRYYDEVFRHCVHRLFDRDTAEDITGEVFLKVGQHLERFNGDEVQLRCWVHRITTNAINSHLRKAARRRGLFQRLVDRDRSQSANPPESLDERRAQLKAAMLSLKPHHQRIIALRFFENLKSDEIGRILGCTPGTARSQLARAVAQLRKRLIAAEVLGPGDNRYE